MNVFVVSWKLPVYNLLGTLFYSFWKNCGTELPFVLELEVQEIVFHINGLRGTICYTQEYVYNIFLNILKIFAFNLPYLFSKNVSFDNLKIAFSKTIFSFVVILLHFDWKSFLLNGMGWDNVTNSFR